MEHTLEIQAIIRLNRESWYLSPEQLKEVLEAAVFCGGPDHLWELAFTEVLDLKDAY